MDASTTFSRTEKGREELLGGQHTLKQRQRQVLFLINDAISVAAIREKLPACQELDGILDLLWQEGYIGQVKRSGDQNVPIKNSRIEISDALHVLGKSRLEAARQYALGILTTLVGERSPAYAKISRAQDIESFTQAVASSRKILAAVASSNQAQGFEQAVLSILNLPESDHLPASSPNPNPARLNGIEAAKAHALSIVGAVIGVRSPIYAKLDEAHNRSDFTTAVAASKKVIAAVASTAQANDFERAVMGRMPRN